ncbi:SH3 domain-containing protein [Sphingobacterium olei]|uniref:SH3 domain-containing protein n=1 Tax=Sphingobacterium olei TaxID=2571155 RepID=A0A4U0NEP2_9SPHI|nr:SH3 domain-containing protein [Sphingobacterium olei]TJZ52526.1 SH3 domain-containing protein [Sphingobacterium olei]
MKTLLNITLSIFLLTFYSCGNNKQTIHKIEQSVVDSTLTIENVGNKIDYDKTRVITSVYVSAREGIEFKQEGDEKSTTLGMYEYGARLDVIEETEKWLGVRERITRKFNVNGSNIESTGWEKVYVIKNKTGLINEVSLVSSDLNVISFLTLDKKTEYFENGKQLKAYLSLELIDKAIFDKNSSSSVDFILADTTVNKKKNGVIELKCKDKTVKFIDRPDAEEERQEFYYAGKVDFLNQYIIGGSYWESLDYRFIDITSGEETATFGEFPYISPDKQNVICIYTNPYETTADLELYAIFNNKIEHVMSASFRNWMPTVEGGAMYWGVDGYLYLTVNHVNSFWKADGNLNDKCQYMRIKIL